MSEEKHSDSEFYYAKRATNSSDTLAAIVIFAFANCCYHPEQSLPSIHIECRVTRSCDVTRGRLHVAPHSVTSLLCYYLYLWHVIVASMTNSLEKY